jgi:hypothetical protein
MTNSLEAVPEKRINQAKRAQMKRMGGMVSQGARKRCKKGKSCGAACINNTKVCWVDFPWAMSNGLSKTRDTVQTRGTSQKQPTPAAASILTNRTAEARTIADEVDDTIDKKGVSSERGDKGYDWERSKGSGSKFLGEGAYGTVTTEGGSGNVVKRGEIGKEEAEALEKVGKLGLGPRLIAAQEDGLVSPSDPASFDMRIGRVAMTAVPGEMIGKVREPDDKIGGQRVADAYWKARAELHKAGIAHNDMHIGNVLVDSSGKGRFVDFGLSVISPKAAFAEAMGAFAQGGNGDYQVRRWKGTGGELLRSALSANASTNTTLLDRAPLLKQVWVNRSRVLAEMAKDGFPPNIVNLLTNGAIKPKGSFFDKGVWTEISDAQARKYVRMLYEGL